MYRHEPSNPVSSASVLLFDSGVGGISIWRELRRQAAGLNCVYLMDNALRPYGELDEPVILERVCHLVERGVREYRPDLIVVACNSASTLVLPELRQRLALPVVGVVPAIKPAAALARNGSGVVALLATPGTIRRQYTDQLIAEFAADCKIRRLGSSELVHLAERKLALGRLEPSAIQRVGEIVSTCAHAPHPEALVLGCTHFPLLKQELQSVLPEDVILVDPSEAIARRVMSLLSTRRSSGKSRLQAENVVIATKPEAGWLEDNARKQQEGFMHTEIWHEPSSSVS